MKSGTRVTDASPTKTRDFTSAWPSSAVAGVRRTCHSGMINVPIDLRESATSERQQNGRRIRDYEYHMDHP